MSLTKSSFIGEPAAGIVEMLDAFEADMDAKTARRL